MRLSSAPIRLWMRESSADNSRVVLALELRPLGRPGVRLAAGLAALAWLAALKPTVSELFWKPVFNGRQDVLLSVPQFSDHVRLAGVDDPQRHVGAMAGEIVEEVQPFQIVGEAIPIHLVGNRSATDLLDLLHAPGQNVILQFFDFSSFCKSHISSNFQIRTNQRFRYIPYASRNINPV